MTAFKSTTNIPIPKALKFSLKCNLENIKVGFLLWLTLPIYMEASTDKIIDLRDIS